MRNPRRLLERLLGREKGIRVFHDSTCCHTKPTEELPFEDIEELNPFQSCIRENYDPERNAVVVAATGTGKTIVAFIAGSCYLNEGKRVVITAPTRELVTELYYKSGEVFGRQLVGLYNGIERSVEDKYVVVTTPEGFLSAVRGTRDWALHSSLLIVDEAHNILDSGRGAALDTAITMFRILGGRILLMSGTFPNAEMVAEHLGADLFVSDYRRTEFVIHEVHATDDMDVKEAPKRLPPGVIPTRTGFIYNRESMRIRKLRNLLEERQDESVLVFVPLKKQGYCLSDALGVPFHNADIPNEEKRRIVADFKSGKLKTVIATTTLAQGVNTPADSVIICGGRRGSYYFTSSDIRQMLGRAGRAKDKAHGFLIMDKVELFHATKEVFTKTLPLPTEQMLMTLLSMKAYPRGELVQNLRKTFAATLFSRRKVEEAVHATLRTLGTCDILKETSGKYALTPEGALLARYFLSPREYTMYRHLAEQLGGMDFTDREKGCILLSALLREHLPRLGDCPARYEKDFKMKLLNVEFSKSDKVEFDGRILDPTRIGAIKHYLEKPSSIPPFLSNAVRNLDRWLGMLGDLERYRIQEDAPGRKWLQDTLIGLKANIIKAAARKKRAEASHEQEQLRLENIS